MKRNDLLWKGLLEDLFDDFLRFFYPNADELFDLDKGFEYLDKELDQLFPPDGDNYAPRYVDKLVKVFIREGGEQWILVHVEVQSYTDSDFAKRMFKYYNRILDQYDRPITAFAIFADINKNFHPKFYRQEFLGTEVYYKYNTYKIIDQDDTELAASDNPFAMAVLCAKIALSRPALKDQQLFDKSYSLAKLLLGKQFSKEKIGRVMNFLRYHIRFEKPDMIVKFVQELTTLTERNKTMGIEEMLLDQAEKRGEKRGEKKGEKRGEKKGELKGFTEVARAMKKDGIAFEQIAKFTKLSTEEIEKL